MLVLSVREKTGAEIFVCFERTYTGYSGVLRRDHHGEPSLDISCYFDGVFPKQVAVFPKRGTDRRGDGSK